MERARGNRNWQSGSGETPRTTQRRIRQRQQQHQAHREDAPPRVNEQPVREPVVQPEVEPINDAALPSDEEENEELYDSADEVQYDLWREAGGQPGVVPNHSEEDDSDDDAHENQDFHNLRDFLGREENNRRVDGHVGVSKAEILLGVLTFAMVYALPQEALLDLLKLINIFFGVNFLPATRYLVDKIFMNKDGMTYHACCPRCKRYISQFDRSTVSVRCRQCNRTIRVKDPMYRDFFAVLDARAEIATLLESNWEHFNNTVRRDGNPQQLSDITDGLLYRRFVDSLPEHLRYNYATCIFNTDGVPVFKSSNNSIWPIQLVINEIPYAVRTANPVTCAIWFGKSKPDMDIYLDIFVREMTDLENNGVTCTVAGVRRNIKLFAICSCVDSMARAPMQGVQQCGGYYSCNWCYIRGTHVVSGLGGAVKYLVGTDSVENRTHRAMLEDVHESHETGLITKGVNRTSRLLNLRFFDIVNGFVPDYMHFLCLGIAKAFFEYWWSMMTPRERKEMDTLISSIKVPNVVQRLARSVKDRKYWKSKEWENWLLYYSLPVMMQIESLSDLTEHWALLVQGFALLMRPTVTLANIRRAHESFVTFVTTTQLTYGAAMMTFNLHQLLHAAQSVINWGPFWAHSGYCFEGNNYKLKKNIHSPKGVISQLCRYVSMKQSSLIMTKHVTDNIPESPILEYASNLQSRRAKNSLSLGRERFFGRFRRPTDDETNELDLSENSRTYSKMVKERCQYGTDRARAARSDNSYAKTSNGQFIRIRKFLVDNDDRRAFVVGYVLNVEGAFIPDESPIFRVISTSQNKSVIASDEITTVCVCTNVNDVVYLTVPPNLLRN